MLIGATCNAFDITLWVYQQNEEGLMHSIQYSTGEESQKQWHCHLILYRNQNDLQGLSNHYNSILSKKRNKGNLYEDYGAEDLNEENLVERTAERNNEDENFMDDFDFEDFGPPNPELILTPTPSPDNTLDDFNPTYVPQNPTAETIFDQPEAAIYNSRGEEKGLVFHILRLLILQLKTLAKFCTTLMATIIIEYISPGRIGINIKKMEDGVL